MNSKQIDCVLALANTLNFNRAAENLFITQPALSYQIKSLETEIGFTIFERSGKGATLTLGGEQLCNQLRVMRAELKKTIESCQNISQSYEDVLRICLPYRTALFLLPHAIALFNAKYPKVFVDITIEDSPHLFFDFLQHKYDIFYAIQSTLSPQLGIEQHHIYDSHIYLVVNNNDPLASLKKATASDLKGKALLVGGGSPKELQQVQHRVLQEMHIDSLTSENHETTLVNIASNRAICLIPGLLNDYNDEFTWIPFDCQETIPCVICTHTNSTKSTLPYFLSILKDLYANTNKLL